MTLYWDEPVIWLQVATCRLPVSGFKLSVESLKSRVTRNTGPEKPVCRKAQRAAPRPRPRASCSTRRNRLRGNFQPSTCNLIELIEEPDVVLEEQSYVVYFVHQGRHAVDAKPERESGELFRIYTHTLEHVRMDHSAAAQLDPSGPLADSASRPAAHKTAEVELRGGLGERKVGGAESSSQPGTEHQLDELLHGALQISHRDPAIDIEAFELKEHRIVSWIRSVSTKHPAWRNNPERRLASLHRMYLDGRRLAPQRKGLGKVKGVGGVTGRVTGWNVEGVKVVVSGLDLRTILDRIAH